MYTNLRKLMTEKDISIEALAQLLHLHRNTIQNKLDGKSEFSFAEAETISNLLFPEYRPSYVFKSDDKPIAV